MSTTSEEMTRRAAVVGAVGAALIGLLGLSSCVVVDRDRNYYYRGSRRRRSRRYYY
jgi:hypothetical protein